VCLHNSKKHIAVGQLSSILIYSYRSLKEITKKITEEKIFQGAAIYYFPRPLLTADQQASLKVNEKKAPWHCCGKKPGECFLEQQTKPFGATVY